MQHDLAINHHAVALQNLLSFPGINQIYLSLPDCWFPYTRSYTGCAQQKKAEVNAYLYLYPEPNKIQMKSEKKWKKIDF